MRIVLTERRRRLRYPLLQARVLSISIDLSQSADEGQAIIAPVVLDVRAEFQRRVISIRLGKPTLFEKKFLVWSHEESSMICRLLERRMKNDWKTA